MNRGSLTGSWYCFCFILLFGVFFFFFSIFVSMIKRVFMTSIILVLLCLRHIFMLRVLLHWTKANAKSIFFFDLCRSYMWALNCILYVLIFKQCRLRFRTNMNQHVKGSVTAIERQRERLRYQTGPWKFLGNDSSIGNRTTLRCHGNNLITN